jgi:hypothetical protein
LSVPLLAALLCLPIPAVADRARPRLPIAIGGPRIRALCNVLGCDVPPWREPRRCT